MGNGAHQPSLRAIIKNAKSRSSVIFVAALVGLISSCSIIKPRQGPGFDTNYEFFSTAYTTLFGRHFVKFTSYNVIDDCPGEVPMRAVLRDEQVGGIHLTITSETCSNVRDTLSQCTQCLDELASELHQQMAMFTSLLRTQPPREININLTQKPGKWKRNFIWKKYSPAKIALSFATFSDNTQDIAKIKSYLQQNVLGPLLHEAYHATAILRGSTDFQSESEAYVFSRCADILSDGRRDGWNLLFLNSPEWREKFAAGLEQSELVQTAQNQHPSLAAAFLADINMHLIELEAERNAHAVAESIGVFCRQYFETYPDLREGFISVGEPLAD